MRSLPYLAYLPRDTRTLLGTPRVGPQVCSIDPGEYLYIRFEKSLTRIFQKTAPHCIPDVLEIDWSTDAKLNKSDYMQIWPIQCRSANIHNSKPEIAGVYKGPKKPSSIHFFLDEFLDDILLIIESGGIFFREKQFPIVLRAFIADAPARLWILNHFGHTFSHPCSKCKVVGIRSDGQLVFTGVEHRIRTDDEYAQCVDDDHHKGPSPLSRLPMGLVSQVPVEYMHLICIGVAKKLLAAWVTDSYGKKMKLSSWNQNRVSKKFQQIARYYPQEFARKPRPLSEYKDYKATEGRLFILYTGPVALQDILDKQGFKHFLLFHAAIRALCHPKLSSTLIKFAKLALQKFVETCSRFYKLTFNSYNVHALLHLAENAEHLGPFDSFSAFSYENNISFFLKYYRKPHRPLQQFAYRQAEREKREEMKSSVMADSIKIFRRHNNGLLPDEIFSSRCVQYKKLQTKNFFINVDFLCDRCVILTDGSVCIVRNIIVVYNVYYLVLNKFQILEDLYDVAIPSLALGVYVCSTLFHNCTIQFLSEVKAKCYLMPYWRVEYDNGSDISVHEEDESISDKYIVSILL
jgi:hypothetical protein